MGDGHVEQDLDAGTSQRGLEGIVEPHAGHTGGKGRDLEHGHAEPILQIVPGFVAMLETQHRRQADPAGPGKPHLDQGRAALTDARLVKQPGQAARGRVELPGVHLGQIERQRARRIPWRARFSAHRAG